MKQRVEITNSKKQKLIGILNDCQSDSLIIFCHGYTASKDMDGFIHLSDSLYKKGISTFRFDFSGSGESQGSKDLSLIQQVADLTAVIEYFQTYKQIYLLGHSLGVLPTLVCANSKNITGLISVNGFFLGNVYRQDFNRAYQTLKFLRFIVPRVKNEWKFMETNTNPSIITKPMLLITTKNDEVLDYRQSGAFGEMLKHKHLVETLSLSGHGISSVDDGKTIASSIASWIM